jgi:hypothetical protein
MARVRRGIERLSFFGWKPSDLSEGIGRSRDPGFSPGQR